MHRIRDEKSSIFKSATVVSFVTVISRIFGLIRDSILASALGASSINDVFNIAFEIPNFLRRVLGEGSLSAVIVPVFTEKMEKDGKESAWKFLSNAFNIILITTLIITALGIILSRYMFIFWGGVKFVVKDESGYLDLGANLTRIMFPYLTFLALTALLMGVLHSFKNFATPAFRSIVLNITVIIAAIIFRKGTPEKYAYIFAWAVLAGAVLGFIILIPPVVRKGFRYSAIIDFKDSTLRKLFLLLLPSFYGLAISELNIVVDKNLANFIGPGCVTALSYSHRLIQLPLAIFAISLATVLLPSITRQVLSKNTTELKETTSFALRTHLLIMIPATVGLIVLSYPISQLIYERGLWTSEGTRKTAIALIFYSVGLVSFGSLRIVTSIFYAKQDMMTPVKLGVVGLVSNIILNLILMRTPLKHGGLALATSIAATINLVLLLRVLSKEMGSFINRKIVITFTKTLLISVIMGIVCYLIYKFMEMGFSKGSTLYKMIFLAVNISIGIAVFIVGCIVAKLSEFKTALSIIFKKGHQKQPNK